MKRIHRNIIRHSLGLDHGKPRSMAYRNHYAVYPDSDAFTTLCEMVDLGLMQAGRVKPGDDIRFFRVTRKGVDEAGFAHRVCGEDILGEKRPDVQRASESAS